MVAVLKQVYVRYLASPADFYQQFGDDNELRELFEMLALLVDALGVNATPISVVDLFTSNITRLLEENGFDSVQASLPSLTRTVPRHSSIHRYQHYSSHVGGWVGSSKQELIDGLNPDEVTIKSSILVIKATKKNS